MTWRLNVYPTTIQPTYCYQQIRALLITPCQMWSWPRSRLMNDERGSCYLDVFQVQIPPLKKKKKEKRNNPAPIDSRSSCIVQSSPPPAASQSHLGRSSPLTCTVASNRWLNGKGSGCAQGFRRRGTACPSCLWGLRLYGHLRWPLQNKADRQLTFNTAIGNYYLPKVIRKETWTRLRLCGIIKIKCA